MSGLDPHLRLVRLRAEAALLDRLNAGYGFADARIPAEVYLRDPAARERVGGSPLRPRDTHAGSLQRVREQIASAEAAMPASESRLSALGARLTLSAGEMAALELAVAYAVDPDVCELCNALSGRRLPALYADVCRDVQPDLATADAWFRAVHADSVARRAGWLAMRDDEIAAEPRLVHWLLGDDRLVLPGIELAAPDDDIDVYLAPEINDQIARVAALVDRRQAVLIQGAQGTGKAAAARALARALGRPLLAGPLHELRGSANGLRDVLSEALLRNAVVYLPGVEALITDGKPDRALAAAIDAHADLCIVGARDSGLPSLPIARPFHLIRIPSPSLDVRREAWRRAVGDDAAEMFAARYVIGPGAISEVATDARAFAAAAGRSAALADVEGAVARRLTLNLGPFAARITRRARFEEMVLPEDVLAALHDMVAMVQQRTKILEGWGYGQHLGLARGVSALFSGEPGTGKTMAASAISGELGLELFRIDLSAVISKWVGETEKHLARIFDEAQSAEAMLLFDEADALFGKRTEVKSSTDRYANLEINYILQRMEGFDGITILTSNHEAAIDPAFMRRLNFRVRFPEPDADERAALWRTLLPPDTGLADIDFSRLAERFEMTGGHIRNAIVRAAVIAARSGRRMQPSDLVEGAQLEYYELGKVMPSLMD